MRGQRAGPLTCRCRAEEGPLSCAPTAPCPAAAAARPLKLPVRLARPPCKARRCAVVVGVACFFKVLLWNIMEFHYENL